MADLDPADAIFVRRKLLAEGRLSPGALGTWELVHFLAGTYRLSPEQQRTLFSNQSVRANYQALKQQFTVLEVPALAAAASGMEVLERDGEGWRLRAARDDDGSAEATIEFLDPALGLPKRVDVVVGDDILAMHDLKDLGDGTFAFFLNAGLAQRLWDGHPSLRLVFLE